MVPTRELATQVKEELDPLLNGKSMAAVAIYWGKHRRANKSYQARH